eukprot:8495309-Pyramimonas_sp.AAC.1
MRTSPAQDVGSARAGRAAIGAAHRDRIPDVRRVAAPHRRLHHQRHLTTGPPDLLAKGTLAP